MNGSLGAEGLVVHKELVIAIRSKDYKMLAPYLKEAINLAWAQLMCGRKIKKKVSNMGQTILLIMVTDESQTDPAGEAEFDGLLMAVGVGRLSTDAYEIKLAQKMPIRVVRA